MDYCEDHGSSIIKFYEGKTILVTGATGFLGILIIEKLLRTCRDLNKIYILVRPKKGKETKQRMDELFDSPCMEQMKEENRNYKEQVILINGDLLQPMCGLSEGSIGILQREVDIIIHCAATVRFDQVIKNATYINVRAMKDLMTIARGMNNLKGFMYISTAYSFCPRKEIDEAFYPPPIEANALIKLVDMIDDEKLKAVTPTLIGKWPNTYVFTKAVAEGLIADEGQDLPMVMVRPSIVLSPLEEPCPGWTNNIYGPSAIIVATALGFMRCTRADKNNYADMVPADYVVNIILAALFQRSKRRGNTTPGSLYNQKIIPVYNYCCTPFSPITWGEFMNMVVDSGNTIPASQLIYYPLMGLRKCVYHHNLSFFLLQTIPAYITEAVLYLIRKEPIALTMLKKVRIINDVLSFFTLRQWEYGTENTVQLWKNLGQEDRKHFHFDLTNFNWKNYLEVYLKGLRCYFLKDSLDTVSASRKKLKILYVVHIMITTSFYLMVVVVLYHIFKLFF